MNKVVPLALLGLWSFSGSVTAQDEKIDPVQIPAADRTDKPAPGSTADGKRSPDSALADQANSACHPAAAGTSASPVTPSAIQPADRSLAQAQAKLALDLLRTVAKADPKATTLSLSPASVSAVLAALALGADAPMRAGITRTLGLAETKEEASIERLRAALRRLDVRSDTAPFQGANAFFVDGRTVLKPGIAEALLAEARVPVRTAALDSPEGIAAVNTFVSAATKGRIPTILDTPPRAVSLMAINAFHFRDCWATAFDKTRTTRAAFNRSDARSVEVDMMHLDEQPIAHAVKGRFAAVELVYRDPAFAMTLVTTTDAPAGVEAFGSAASLLAGETLGVGPVDLALPAFGAQNAQDLLTALSELGLASGLTSRKSLSGFADGVVLSAVLQKTLVSVDESGTVAAAATAAMATRSAAGRRSQRISFDRPFVFALRHRPTGLVLLSGYVAEPHPLQDGG